MNACRRSGRTPGCEPGGGPAWRHARDGLLRIGTRSSPVAMAQAEQVAGLLRAEWLVREVRVVPSTTSGDRWTGDLAKAGGKGSFVGLFRWPSGSARRPGRRCSTKVPAS
ncbi:hypothetical protein [Uniformispora flossi]|uniref:hypothetical protein n=1 Tax=Uniformispora flossi TaxID=3390723 RepID=UPI003D08B822